VQLHPEYPVTTERLSLRPLSHEDIPDLLAYRSLPEVCRYLPFEPMDEAVLVKRLEGDYALKGIDNEGDVLILGMELTAEGGVVGDLMIRFHSERHRMGEIGWVLNPEVSGQGIATEGARAILQLAFDGLGLHRVIARIDAENEPSRRLATRLGMRQETELISNEWSKGRWRNEVDFAMLEEEWEELRSRPD
jgi:RimJ/RimL family protein N-acetyltransferase